MRDNRVKSLKIDNRNLLNRPFRVAILLNSKFSAHCRILSGVSDYVQQHAIKWSVVLNHELRYRKGEELDLWFDAIIADYNQPHIRQLLEPLDIPVIGLTSGMDQLEHQVRHPVITLNNTEIVSMAYEFLLAKGMDHIAFYGLKDDNSGNWQTSRLEHYLERQQGRGKKNFVYMGNKASFTSWTEELDSLSHWLDGLPKPCGVIVTSDVRARTLISACESRNLIIPDEVSVVSIGDIQHSEFFQPVSLSTVDPNYYQMGYRAGELLAASLSGSKVKKQTLIQPELISEGSSTDFRAAVDHSVIRALHFIRQNYSNGIKAQQVIDYAGCSRTLLEQKFKAQVGHSIHNEIHNLRLEKVCRLLIEEEALSIAEVAKLSGYPSSQYLYELFRKEFGLTPTEYKQQSLQSCGGELS